ncbi:hypothetical protein N39L_08490 [Limnospira platensis NIES-39]|uniref:Uncharacterized protein n=1 Tax=Limnospira platensis NIES-46 TaxID=1236695 RepID=A0A5M3TDQ7_LIMPL|nr:hypothetical protein APPUASWS_010800 [Arthrospira platensis str. Paraca]BDT11126.1 hypothetical protein N39L_08490 [Arthrospira platensis NIES-39]GCE96565.1 hypothetical protein NIES46_46370 [Arthrospira platensis NIES-46]
MRTEQRLSVRVWQLPISDRWRLVQCLLTSIQQETLTVNSSTKNVNYFAELHPWTQSLIKVIQLGTEEPPEPYVDY